MSAAMWRFSEVDLQRGNLALDDALRSHRLKELLDDGVAVGVRGSVQIAGSSADPVGDVERCLVLCESTRRGIPFSRCGTGSWTIAEEADDGCWPLGPRDASANAEVSVDSLVDLVHRRVESGSALEHRRR